MRRHRRDLSPQSSMNLTSLLDVTFVLLIAFMIVAPTINKGLPIDLPKVKEASTDTPKEPVRIALTKPKAPDEPPDVYFDGSKVNMDELREFLDIAYEKNRETGILFQADKDVPYGYVMEVQGAIMGAGFDGFLAETDPHMVGE